MGRSPGSGRGAEDDSGGNGPTTTSSGSSSGTSLRVASKTHSRDQGWVESLILDLVTMPFVTVSLRMITDPLYYNKHWYTAVLLRV